MEKLANALQVNKSLHTLHLEREWMGRGSGCGACSERGREGGREVRGGSGPMTGRQGRVAESQASLAGLGRGRGGSVVVGRGCVGWEGGGAADGWEAVRFGCRRGSHEHDMLGWWALDACAQ